MGGRRMWLQGQSLVGLVAIPAIAWALSERHGAIKPTRLARILIGGVGLQVLIAGLMGFKEQPYFQADPGAREAPKVDFNK